MAAADILSDFRDPKLDGGRRVRAYMNLEEESTLLMVLAQKGTVDPLRLHQIISHRYGKVALSTAYRMIKRHGYRPCRAQA